MDYFAGALCTAASCSATPGCWCRAWTSSATQLDAPITFSAERATVALHDTSTVGQPEVRLLFPAPEAENSIELSVKATRAASVCLQGASVEDKLCLQWSTSSDASLELLVDGAGVGDTLVRDEAFGASERWTKLEISWSVSALTATVRVDGNATWEAALPADLASSSGFTGLFATCGWWSGARTPLAARAWCGAPLVRTGSSSRR